MQITDIKTKFKPIVKVNDEYIVSLNYKPLTNMNGTWTEIRVPASNIKTTIDLLEYINNVITKKVKHIIVNRCTWNGYNIHLDTENQANYKANYDLAKQANGVNLPFTCKFKKNFKTVYHTFTNVEELEDFYVTTVKHINDAQKYGWELKDSIDPKVYVI